VIDDANEAYNLLRRTGLAQVMAKQLAGECPTIEVSDEALTRTDQALGEALDVWFAENTDNEASLKALVGYSENGGPSFGVGVALDLIGNMTVYYLRGGFSAFSPEGACAAAEKEMASGSFIGTFLIDEASLVPLGSE
jgi:hypothetical protein